MSSVQSHMLFKGKGCIDEKLMISDVADLSSLDTSYCYNGMIITCTSNSGHYIYLPNATDITTSPVSGSWYLKEQLEFDELYKVGYECICLSLEDLPNPLSPATCQWSEQSSYDGKVLYPSSTQDLGTTVNQSITIRDHILTVNEIPAHNHTLYLNSNYGRGRQTSYAAWACGSSQNGSSTLYTVATGSDYGHIHTMPSNTKFAGLTIKVYRRVS